RRLIDQIAVVHFAPTQTAVRALLDEGHSPDSVFLTGNTGVDAVLAMADRVQHIPLDDFPTLNTLPGEVRCAGAPLLLVTAHRRESFNGGIANICRALLQLCDRHPTLRIALPVHPNPEVHRIIRPALSQVDGVTLLPPLPYDAMVRLLMRANLLLTDSGGLQEEAPSLGLRTFVSRSCTERLEGIQAGAAVLVGTDPKTIGTKVSAALAHPGSQRWTGPNPYGAGDAAVRIAEVLSHRAIARGMG
ncbi:MAG: UDP-N-acetylglucosamine 2-epimerase (non-hydrolyzing), partial [Rhodobacterales bacterium]|nr:UDP-N-acetylglucosamine 2-epimerase (non-hydrolyzing) [Rhodobacterales bacterium]